MKRTPFRKGPGRRPAFQDGTGGTRPTDGYGLTRDPLPGPGQPAFAVKVCAERTMPARFPQGGSRPRRLPDAERRTALPDGVGRRIIPRGISLPPPRRGPQGGSELKCGKPSPCGYEADGGQQGGGERVAALAGCVKGRSVATDVTRCSRRGGGAVGSRRPARRLAPRGRSRGRVRG
jgi:hypothetical protein